MPALRDKARGASDGARVPGAVGEVVAEDVGLVRDDEDVILRRALSEGGDLLLDLLVAAVRAPARARLVDERTLLDDLAAEALGGAADRVGEQLVVFAGAENQEP